MFGSEVLDVAIGIVLVYSLLSIICSALHELLEAFLRYRARVLERGIRELLGGDQILATFYNHPLISSLFPGEYRRGSYSNLPSYIPARNFALAMMDLMSPADAQGPSGARGATAVISTPGQTIATLGGLQLMRLRDAANSTLPEKSRQALLTLIDAGDSDPVKVRENVEQWFNSAMDRVSGQFKRRTHITITGIAIMLAVALNVDSIALVNHLSTDKSVRESLASVAQEYVRSEQAGGALPSAATIPAGSPAANIPACLTDPRSSECKVEVNVQRIRMSGLALGWTRSSISADARGVPENLSVWLLKILGILVTALATSVGAPFWFDILNRFVVVRSTIKPHEKSPEESSKD